MHFESSRSATPAVLFALPFLLAAGVPVPERYEAGLRERGFVEDFLPPGPGGLPPSADDSRRGWLVYHRDRNYEVLPNSRPAPEESIRALRMRSTPGEMESDSLCVYALRDVPGVAVSAALEGAPPWLHNATKIEDVLFHAIQYQARTPARNAEGELIRAGAAARRRYVRYPTFLHSASPHDLPAESSRLYWITVTAPPSAPAGIHTAAIRFSDARGNTVRIPFEFEVLPFRLAQLDRPRFGAFLSGAPFARGEWAFMKRYGMDALQWFWNAHPIQIRNDNGVPKLDFTEYDAFVKGMRDAGMRGPLVLSLGNSWLGHYEIKLAEALGLRLMKRQLEGRMVTLMDMTDPRWEKPYLEGLRQIFEHAKVAQWPPLALLINDEPTKHIMAFYPYRYHLIKKHFPEVPVYGVFFQPEKDPGPLLHSSDIVVANRDLDRMKLLATQFGKRFWTYNNVTADESFGKIRLLYGQIPAYYESEVMFFWCWNYWIGNPWDDFDGGQSDADWVAVYPSVDGAEPVRTLAIEAAREAIDDMRYLKTLERVASLKSPARWEGLKDEIRRRQRAMFEGIVLDNRIYSDADFFIKTRNDDTERLRSFAIERILEMTKQ